MSNSFHWVDYILFVATLVLSAGIGVWAAYSGKGQNTTSQFLMGDRKLQVFPVLMSIAMSYTSAILVLGSTAEVYMFGFQAFANVIGIVLGHIYVALVFVPFFYKLRLTSTVEYLEKRFNSRAVRILGDFFLMLYFITYMGISSFAPATALEGAIGFPIWASILIQGVLATFYTSIGGMKAVVWTDAVQGVIFFGGIIAVLILGSNKTGGLANIFEVADQAGRLDNFNFNLDFTTARITVWSIITHQFLTSLDTVGIGQASVQRYISLPSLPKARWVVIGIAPIMVILTALTYLMGFIVYAYFNTVVGCDPLREGSGHDSNQLLSRFIMDVVDYPGIPGLFLAVLFAGALSTMSSGLSALTAVAWTDILEPRFKHYTETRKALITKMLTVLFGLLSLVVAFTVKYMPVHIVQATSTLLTACSAPLLGMFLLGITLPWVNKWGVMVSAVLACAWTYWISLGQNASSVYVHYLDTVVTNCTDPRPIPSNPTDVFPLYGISYGWYSAMALLIMFTVAPLISFATGFTDPKTIRPEYVVPWSNILCRCLPSSTRRKMRCGVPEKSEDVDEVTNQYTIGDNTANESDVKGTKYEYNNDAYVSKF